MLSIISHVPIEDLVKYRNKNAMPIKWRNYTKHYPWSECQKKQTQYQEMASTLSS